MWLKIFNIYILKCLNEIKLKNKKNWEIVINILLLIKIKDIFLTCLFLSFILNAHTLIHLRSEQHDFLYVSIAIIAILVFTFQNVLSFMLFKEIDWMKRLINKRSWRLWRNFLQAPNYVYIEFKNIFRKKTKSRQDLKYTWKFRKKTLFS